MAVTEIDPKVEPHERAPWHRRRATWIAVVVVVALGVWWFGFRSDGSSNSAAVSTENQLVTVTRGDLANTVSAVGTVAAAQTDNLSFTQAGTVTAVNVAAGDTVKAGQVLATMDSAALQASVASAESTLANAQAKLSDDQASGASAAQLSADQTSIQTATDTLTNAQNALAGAQLVATFDGTVASMNLTVGEQLGSGGSGATSGTGSSSGTGRSSSQLGSSNNGIGGNGSSSSSSSPQIQVVSRGQFTVSLPVSSADIANVANGASVTLTVTSSSANRAGGFGPFGGGGFLGQVQAGGTASGSTGATTPGKVTNVSKVATTSSGVAQYPVTVSFTDNSGNFYIGATVSGAIATQVRPNVIQVPVRAVTTNNGVSTVVVATKGKLDGPTAVRTVQTGATANGMVEITSGLKEGEQVLVPVLQFTTPTTTANAGGGTGFQNGGFGNRGVTNGNVGVAGR